MLTNDQKRKRYETAWGLIDAAAAELNMIQLDDDISDVLGRLQLLKDKIEEKVSVLHEFDPS